MAHAKAVCDNGGMLQALRKLFDWIIDHASWDLAMRCMEKTKWKAIVSLVASAVLAVWQWFSHRTWPEIIVVGLVSFVVIWALLELLIWRTSRLIRAKRERESPVKADTEEILFDSRQGLYASDVKGVPGELWRNGAHAPTKGEGTLRVEDGVLNLQRSNTDERFELWLQRYSYKGNEDNKIPKDESISGNRQIRVSCEAKASCNHTLRFTLRDFVGGRVLAREVQITSNDWTSINMTFMIPPHEGIQLSIFDQGVSKAPSSIQIRNLVVGQKK